MIEHLRFAALAWALAWAGTAHGAGSVMGRRLVASPDGSRFAVLGESGEVRVVGVDGVPGATVSFGSELSELAFSPDGMTLAACLLNGSVASADLATGIRKTLDSAASCADLSWSPDGKRVFFAVAGLHAGQPPEESIELRSVVVQTGERRTLHSARRRVPLPPVPPSKRAVPAPHVVPNPGPDKPNAKPYPEPAAEAGKASKP